MKWLIFAFVAIPALEFYLLIQLGMSLGAFETFALIIATGIVGAALARMQGLSVLKQIQNATALGQMPTQALLEGACVLLCGALLVTPGMVTDVVGVLGMMPFARQRISKWVQQKFQAHMLAQAQQQQQAYGAARPVVIDMKDNNQF